MDKEKTENKAVEKNLTKQQRLDRVLAIIALAAIAAAWFIGNSRMEAELTPFLHQAFPKAEMIEPVEGKTGYYQARTAKLPEPSVLGYLAVGTGHGYGGRLSVVTAVSAEGVILDIVVVGHRETASFMQRVLAEELLTALKGKNYTERFWVGEDVDSISGATYTARALADAARMGCRNIARDVLEKEAPPEPTPRIQFSLAEVLLIGLFVFGWIGTRKWFKYKKSARWVTMLTGLVVLGFMYNKFLTLIFVNKMLLGFWPQWQTHLYWYLLVGGIFLVLLLENKNMYCERICPFGTVQEGVGMIGGAKLEVKGNVRLVLRWFQRALSLSVILAALVYSHPAFVSYEIFGAFFRLIGSTFLFVVLGIVMVSSLFIKRPWCNYLCPLRPVLDYARLIRNWR